MKYMIFCAFIILSSTCGYAECTPNIQTGEDLFCFSEAYNDAIKKKEVTSDYIFLVGFLNGYNLTRSTLEADQKTNKIYCCPDTVKHKQIVFVIMEYLINNPRKRYLPASKLIDISLQKAFPCKKNNPIKNISLTKATNKLQK